MASVTVETLFKLKQSGEKFTCITAYDASFSHLFSAAGVETLLVGDSLGMVLQGHNSTLPVSIEDICYHTSAVNRGNQGALIIADLPFMSYSHREAAFENAAKLMRAGAHVIKVEGGEWLYQIIAELTERGVPVCGHLGLTPQSVHLFGGYKVQGRGEQAQKILQDAHKLQQAGAKMLVLECVPTPLAQQITAELSIPVIGIGAGPATDGQVLVMHDMLGITPGKAPRFSKNFLQECGGDIQAAVQLFIQQVKQGQFPDKQHSFE